MPEKTALQGLTEKYKVNVTKCLLFINKDLPFLVASCDGMIDNGEG